MLASILAASVLVYAVYVLQLKQVELQETVQVVVPRHFVDAGELITRQDVELRPLVRAAYDPRMVARYEDVIGLETVIPLAADEPIMDWKLDRHRLMPRGGQLTFQIPKSYVLSVSSHIRAGDRVNVYVSGEEGSRPLFTESVVVASVKTAFNTDAATAGSNLTYAARGDYEQLYMSRRQTADAIDTVNLNLTEAQWLQIDRACNDGTSQLVIAYAPPQLQEDHSL